MAIQIERDASAVLAALAEAPRDQYVEASALASQTGLNPDRLNDATAFLVDSGYAEWVQTYGTAPFDFADATITSRGRYEHQRLRESTHLPSGEPIVAKAPPPESLAPAIPARPPSPVGSPFGFTDEDWETVAERKSRPERLYVVLGHQHESEHFDPATLKRNINAMFQAAVDAYKSRHAGRSIALEYTVLAAGYGEHLFNEIARDIISADVAVFETSDLNPNVMLEMGVALTWGVRVLPIKVEGRPRPPSDVSGQTWADYRNSAEQFVDRGHESKLVRMIERALRKKGPAV
jgi:hypothetical protein